MSRSAENSLDNSFQGDSLLDDFNGPNPYAFPIDPMKEGDLYTIQVPTVITKRQPSSYLAVEQFNQKDDQKSEPAISNQQQRSDAVRRRNKIQRSLLSMIQHDRKSIAKKDQGTLHQPDEVESITSKAKQDEAVSEIPDVGEASNRAKGVNLFKIVMAKSYFNNFIENLLQRSYVKKLHHFTPYQNKLMDDLTYYEISEQNPLPKQKKIQQNVFQLALKLIEILNLLRVFEPNGVIFITWEIFHMFTILVIFFWIPFKLSFNIQSGSAVFGYQFTISTLEIIFLSVIGADILLSVNLAYIDKGVVIRSRKKILTNYLKGPALVDITSLTILISNFLLFQNDDGKGLWSVLPFLIYYYLRTQKIKSIMKELENYFHLGDSQQDLFGLIKLIFTIFLIGHLCACTWHGVAYYMDGTSRTWLDDRQISFADNLTKYLYSFYWATMTMTTVGYGDVTPQNNVELLTANVTMYLASGVFAFSVNSIGVMLNNLNARHTAYQKNINILNTFLLKNQVNPDLQMRIRSYFDYIWMEEMEMNDEEISTVIQRLSVQLQEEIKYELRVSILRSCQALTKFSEKTLRQLSMVMEEVRFSPDQMIITQNQADDGALYLIIKGMVQIFFQEQSSPGGLRVLKELKVGDSFGEYSFFTGLMRTASASSLGFSKAFRIKRGDMIQIISQNDREIFCSIKDNLSIYGNQYQINMRCYSCDKVNHLVLHCPALHYVADKERVLKQYLFPFYQERQFQQRKTPKFHHFSTLLESAFLAKQLHDLWNSNQFQEQITDIDGGMSQMGYDDEIEGEYAERSYNKTNTNRSKSVVSRKQSQLEQQQQDNLNQIDESAESNEMEDLAPARKMTFARKTHNYKMTHITQQTAGFGDVENVGSQHPSHHPTNILQGFERYSMQLDSIKRSSQKKISLSLAIPAHRKGNSREDLRELSQTSHTSANRRRVQQKFNPKASMDNPPSQVSIDMMPTLQGKRTPSKHRSLKTARSNRTRISMKRDSSYNPMHGTFVQEIQEEQDGFDKMQTYKTYFPLNNYDYLIRRYNRFQKMYKRRMQPELSLYTLSFFVLKKAARMRKSSVKNPSHDDTAIRIDRDLKGERSSIKKKRNTNISQLHQISGFSQANQLHQVNSRRGFSSLLSNTMFKNSQNFSNIKVSKDFF